MRDKYTAEEWVSCPMCVDIVRTFYFLRKTSIVNYQNSCVLCEKCLERRSRTQMKVERKEVKIEMEKGFPPCPCGS